MRLLAALAGALIAGTVCTGAASAASLNINASIQGAGGVMDVATFWTCAQSPPVSDREAVDCGSRTVPYSGSGGSHTVRLVVASTAGWTFQRWAGCDSVTGTTCNLDVPSVGPDRTVDPRAIFKDTVAPQVSAFNVLPSAAAEGRFTASWTSNERGVTFKCAIDNLAAVGCDSGYSFTLPEGKHRLRVTPEDRSGNIGADVEAQLDVVDTVLDEAPAEGAYVATWRFAAHTGFGTAIECSLDGGAWFDCGGASGALTLPALADGRHTLRARGVGTTAVDRFPAIRTWTVDTTAPDTTMTGLKIEANEPVASFRCRVDGADTPCSTILPNTPGTHTFEAAAVDHAGNVDPTPARYTWTVETPTASTVPVFVPMKVEVPATEQPIALDVYYSYSRGRLTRLVVSGPAGFKLTVKRPGTRATATTVAKLVGKRLPRGTKITARAGRQTRTVTVR